MSNRSMIKRVTAFLMTLTVVCLNIFTAEMIHALADSIPEKSLEGTVVWDEEGSHCTGNSIPSQSAGKQCLSVGTK